MIIKQKTNTLIRRHGLTLIELVIVLAILVALGSLVIPQFPESRHSTAVAATRANLVVLRDAATAYFEDTKTTALPGYPVTLAEEPQRFHIRWLFQSPVSGSPVSEFDPDVRLGWNGPYIAMKTGTYGVDAARNLTVLYGDEDDPALLDAFTGTPIVIQWANAPLRPCDLRIVSAGPDGVVDIPPATATADLTDADVGDDEYVAIQLR